MVDNEPDKHHFAPRCYIKRWAGPDRRLVEFKRRHGKVEGRWTAPKGTGYRPGLYTIPDAADGRKNLVESRYLHRVDTDGQAACIERRHRFNPNYGFSNLTVNSPKGLNSRCSFATRVWIDDSHFS